LTSWVEAQEAVQIGIVILQVTRKVYLIDIKIVKKF